MKLNDISSVFVVNKIKMAQIFQIATGSCTMIFYYSGFIISPCL